MWDKHKHVLCRLDIRELESLECNIFGFCGKTSGKLPLYETFRKPEVFPSAYHSDFCETCGNGGTLLCCELCPRTFHYFCTEPPTNPDLLSTGDWLCNACGKKNEKPVSKSSYNKYFSELSRIFPFHPKVFELPLSYKTFIKKLENNWYPQHSLNEPNASKLCYICHLSSIRGPMAYCKYCPLSFHMDCLDPPLLFVPRRWMCPNHWQRFLCPHKSWVYRYASKNSALTPRGSAGTEFVNLIERSLNMRYRKKLLAIKSLCTVAMNYDFSVEKIIEKHFHELKVQAPNFSLKGSDFNFDKVLEEFVDWLKRNNKLELFPKKIGNTYQFLADLIPLEDNRSDLFKKSGLQKMNIRNIHCGSNQGSFIINKNIINSSIHNSNDNSNNGSNNYRNDNNDSNLNKRRRGRPRLRPLL